MTHRADGLNDIFEHNVEMKSGQVKDTPANNSDIANKKYVDDEISSSTPWTIDSSTQISYDNVVDLGDTTSSTTGVISKNGDNFIHNFHHPTGDTTIPRGSNTFIGKNAGNFTMGSTATEVYHGSDNVCIGEDAGNSLTTGYRNLFLGYRAGWKATEAPSVVAIGYTALQTLTTGSNSVAIGRGALLNATAGSNTAIGAYALNRLTTASTNIAIGGSAGFYIDGANNVLIGNNTGYGVSGSGSGIANNTIIGHVSARYIEADSVGNTLIGYAVAQDLTTGNNNICMGRIAAQNITTGSTNIIIGYNGANTLTTGNGNIIFGYNVDVSSSSASSELNIGNAIKGNLSSGDVDVPADFTAGTIQADNGYTGSFTNGDGNTVTVVGGIITGVA